MFGVTDNNIATTVKAWPTYILFYALGLVTQVPHNFFITANDYWMFKFRDTNVFWNHSNAENRTRLQSDFTSSFSIVSSVTGIGGIFIAMVLARWVTIHKRLIMVFISMVLLFLVTIILVGVNTDTWQSGFFAITLLIGGLLNGAGSVCTLSVFQLSSKFPPGYVAAMLSGHAICGIFAALNQIFTLAVGASSKINAFIYFTIGFCCVFGTMVFYLFMINRSKFFYSHALKEESTSIEKPSFSTLKNVFNEIKFYLMTVIIVMGSTVMVHPAVTSLVKSVNHGTNWTDLYFVPVSTFLFYYTFEFIGRELAGRIRKPSSGIVILILGIVKIAFIPMLMFSNAQPRSHLPVIFGSDAAYMTFIIIFAFTNGYLVNLCIVRIPLSIPPEDIKISMMFIVIFMVSSLGLCSFLSILLVRAL